MVQNKTVTNSITHQYKIESKINAERTKPCLDTNTGQNHNKKTDTKFPENEAMFGATFLKNMTAQLPPSIQPYGLDLMSCF